MKSMVSIFCGLAMMFGIYSMAWSVDVPVMDHPSDMMILANDGFGPGNGTGNDGEGPQDGTGYGPGDCTTAAITGAVPTYDGFGPGNGTGNDGEGPQDGSGYGPGEC